MKQFVFESLGDASLSEDGKFIRVTAKAIDAEPIEVVLESANLAPLLKMVIFAALEASEVQPQPTSAPGTDPAAQCVVPCNEMHGCDYKGKKGLAFRVGMIDLLFALGDQQICQHAADYLLAPTRRIQDTH